MQIKALQNSHTGSLHASTTAASPAARPMLLLAFSYQRGKAYILCRKGLHIFITSTT